MGILETEANREISNTDSISIGIFDIFFIMDSFALIFENSALKSYLNYRGVWCPFKFVSEVSGSLQAWPWQEVGSCSR